MNSSARLLAVIGCCSIFSGCGLSESNAQTEPDPVPAVNTSSEPAADVESITSVSTTALPPAPVNESELVDESGSVLVAQTDSVVESESDETETESTARTEDPSPMTEDTDAESRYTYSEDHDSNGIGKFYMGREIAQVMGHQGIAWLERPEREEEERLSLLIECLNIEPGITVADIGAGSGVITTRLCDAVGEDGTVVAVDIQQEMLDALQLKCHELGYRNVELVLGTPESPQLAEGTLDLVIMVDVYHEFDHPYEMLLEISRSLKPGGRVAFVEYRKEDPTVPIKEVHKMTEAQVRLEAEQPEFQLEYVETVDELPRQHVIVFRRMEPTAEP
jgi:ubiquinone/menaquinone biosynthesis C-methylase UbiE